MDQSSLRRRLANKAREPLDTEDDHRSIRQEIEASWDAKVACGSVHRPTLGAALPGRDRTAFAK
jgi:hypothetical protein